MLGTMDVRSANALPAALTRPGDALRPQNATRPTTASEIQKPAAGRSMDDARAAARAAFAKVVSQPARIDTAQRLADARQAAPDKPLPRGSLINMVV
jgi:hypothetical protein